MARTHKDDLRSLGKVMYQLTTGRKLDQSGSQLLLFPRDTPADLRKLITGLLDGKFESAQEASKVIGENGEPIADKRELAALVAKVMAEKKRKE